MKFASGSEAGMSQSGLGGRIGGSGIPPARGGVPSAAGGPAPALARRRVPKWPQRRQPRGGIENEKQKGWWQ